MKKLVFLIFVLITFLCKAQESGIFKYLNINEMKTKTLKELRIIRNEVFARKGYVFQSKDLQEYFSKQIWYKADPNSEIQLSTKEKVYINQIKNLEKSLLQNNCSCINCIGKQNINLLPLISADFLEVDKNPDKFNKLKPAQVNYTDMNPIVNGNLCGGGYAWNITCFTNIKYQLMFYVCHSDNLLLKLAVLKDDKSIDFIELYDSSLYDEDGGNIIDGFYDVDFKLDENYLEVYKIYRKRIDNPTEDTQFDTKEIRREITKYSLSKNGLVIVK
ncbi:YARHG domain-containing protein [Cellulophaga sp. L1A9]|uniref:YARHG domain-containing protein n=1 Tax=Cellulophaga sp. L1A9 TaxID=2686362 RepID=UPI00131D29C0|nr:YARHG domain-containing protein [Cellulophaga sp. L1A9]